MRSSRRIANAMPEAEKRDFPPPQHPRWPTRATKWTIGLIRDLLDWIGQHELSVLLGLTGAAVAVLAFIRLADAVGEGETTRFDQWAVRAMRQPGAPSKPIGPLWLAEVARDLTALGGVAVLTLI